MQHIFLRKEKAAKFVCSLCGKDRLEVEVGGQRGEAECSLLKRQVGKSSANEKHASRFPFWRERGDHLIHQMVESRILYVNQKE